MNLETYQGFLVDTSGLLSELVNVLTTATPPLTLAQLEKLPPRERVFEVERAITRHTNTFPGALLPVKHYIAGGVYLRELFIPKGVVLTGYIHRHEHLAMYDGDISIYDGIGLRRLTGRGTFTSEAGVKRAGYAHEDTFFTTIHRLSNPRETDISKIEDELMTATYEEALQ